MTEQKPTKANHVTLTHEERAELERMTRVGTAAVAKLAKARVLLVAKVVLVTENLNTHAVASLYEAFAPAEFERITDKLEIHHTPKHGGWLNVAEVELSVLGRQCLDRRIPDRPTLAGEVAAWESGRNGSGVDWQFTTSDARAKLRRL